MRFDHEEIVFVPRTKGVSEVCRDDVLNRQVLTWLSSLLECYSSKKKSSYFGRRASA
jgi:hypothetical protein